MLSNKSKEFASKKKKRISWGNRKICVPDCCEGFTAYVSFQTDQLLLIICCISIIFQKVIKIEKSDTHEDDIRVFSNQ